MKVNELIKLLDARKISGDILGEISGVACDSKKVAAGSVFVAVRGAHVDGHSFVNDAVARGASVLVTEHEVARGSAVNVVVDDTKAALAKIAAAFFAYPSREMKVIGITGTNGKTTSTYLIEAALKRAGDKAGVIGTVTWRYAGKEIDAPNTTPMALELQELLGDMKKSGVSCVVMEVSSHACDQSRIKCVDFDVAAFTNLTRDHLDYHHDIETYYQAKKRFFSEYLNESCKSNKTAVINIDDEHGARLAEEIKSSGHKIVTFGFSKAAEMRIENLVSSTAGNKFDIVSKDGKISISSKLCGRFNASNVTLAFACLTAAGIDSSVAKAGVESLTRVHGRLDPVENDSGISVFVDYAHTPDALENVISTIREISKARLITVFGCGGDRDRTKRPVMGRIAASMSDVVIVTSDNPRTENAAAIIGEIIPGVRESGMQAFGRDGRGFLVEEDRFTAIERAISLAKEGDVILIAGKGHENYQIIGKEKRHFDDRETAKEILKRK